MGNIFGTDGIRGRANTFPVTAETFLAVGRSAGTVFSNAVGGGSVVIGTDTRRSCSMIQNALVAGLTSVGVDVLLVGQLPSPAVGMLTRSLRSDLGIMISASHNPYYDNGIKFFGPSGSKISEEEQRQIETGLRNSEVFAAPERVGRVTYINGAAARYIEFVKKTIPTSLRLDGLKVVVDAANGAAFEVAPKLIWELGAEVVTLGTKPNGININLGCGSTAPEACQRKVLETGAHLGIALDGDADRVKLVDEQGRVVSGDQLMALVALRAKRENRLQQRSIVSSVMSNSALGTRLADAGIDLIRTRVGDRHVVDKMREIGTNIGGEQSGLLVLSDHSATGDGLIGALQVLAEMTDMDLPASKVLSLFDPKPQVHRNVLISRSVSALDIPEVRAAISDAKRQIGASGRLIVRPSGTEPMIRIMAEGDDETALERITRTLDQRITAVSRALRGSEVSESPPGVWSVGAPPVQNSPRSRLSSVYNFVTGDV